MSRVDNRPAERRSRTVPDGELSALAEGRHGDPFAVLGPHADGDMLVVRACVPGARSVTLTDSHGAPLAEMTALRAGGVFGGHLPADVSVYQLLVRWADGSEQLSHDPYAFGLLLGELDLHLIAEGRHFELGTCLGAQCAGSTVSRACALPCGPPMQGACRSSAISTAGSPRSTRCGCATPAASGNCSSLKPWAPVQAAATSSTCLTRAARNCPTRLIRWHWRPKRRRPRPRS